MNQSLSLRPRSRSSFELPDASQIAALHSWLEQRGFVCMSVKNSVTEAYRLLNDDCGIVIIYHTGTALVQGAPTGQLNAIQILSELLETE